MNLTNQDVLDIFRKTDALRSGHFALRSGLHSDQFFQCALVLQHPAHTVKLCESLIAKAPPLRPDVVIAPALGGISVGYEIGRQLGARTIFAEKVDGRLELRRGFTIEPGERVVVAEDVVTRGGRVQETVAIVEGCGGVVEAILVLVNRSGGQAKFDYPLYELLAMTPHTWPAEECPLCQQGIPLERPGSK